MSKDKKTTKGKKTTENTATTSAAIMPITHNLKDYVVTEPVVSKAEEQMRAVIKKPKSKKVVDVVAKSKETTEAAFKELHKEPEKLNAEKVTKAKTTKKVNPDKSRRFFGVDHFFKNTNNKVDQFFFWRR